MTPNHQKDNTFREHREKAVKDGSTFGQRELLGLIICQKRTVKAKDRSGFQREQRLSIIPLLEA